MKKWSHQLSIIASIEDVWQLFDQTLENTKRFVPNLESIEPIEETEEVVGSVYRYVLKVQRLLQEQEVTIVDYEDTPNYKKIITKFEIPKMLEVRNEYELKRLGNTKTELKVNLVNIPLRFDMKILLMLASKKRSVVDLSNRIRLAAEADYRASLNEL